MLFSFFISGVPVKPMKQAFGRALSIWMFASPYWLRWLSSTSTKRFSSSMRNCFESFAAAPNFWSTVVMTAT